MAHQLAQLKSQLSQLPLYKDPRRVEQDIAQCVLRLPDLRTDIQLHVADDGTSSTLVRLHGLVAIDYKRNTYYIPISVWVGYNYPQQAPLCYVTPTSTMRIAKQHPHVDPNGLVSIPYIQEWSANNSNLEELLGFMASAFSAMPPVYAVPAQQAQPQPQPQPQPHPQAQAQFHQPQHQFPAQFQNPHIQQQQQQQQQQPSFISSPQAHPFFAQPFQPQPQFGVAGPGANPPGFFAGPPGGAVPGVSFGQPLPQPQPQPQPQHVSAANPWQPQPQPQPQAALPQPQPQPLEQKASENAAAAGPLNRAQQKEMLVREVTLRLQRRLLEFETQAGSELDTLKEDRARLEAGAQLIQNGLQSLTEERSRLRAAIQEMEERISGLQAFLDQHEARAQEPLDANACVQFSDVWSQQLFEAVAKDHAQEDTLFALSQALANDRIALPEFLRLVRKSAESQYYARALARHISQRMERSQQKQQQQLQDSQGHPPAQPGSHRSSPHMLQSQPLLPQQQQVHSQPHQHHMLMSQPFSRMQ